MVNKKEKLITAISRAVHSLKTDIVQYDWRSHSQCNCGIVTQAILGIDSKELGTKFQLETLSLKDNVLFNVNKTWKGLVQATCSSTGIPIRGMLKELYENGMTPEDIVHLEFMENEAILKKGNIKKADITSKVLIREKKKMKRVPSKTAWGKFWNLHTTKEEIIKAHYKNKKVTYHESKENLIKYLSAWKEILKEDLSENTAEDSVTLNKKLLQAVANEDYQMAASLRDKLTTL
jgi:hypothetical protein